MNEQMSLLLMVDQGDRMAIDINVHHRSVPGLLMDERHNVGGGVLPGAPSLRDTQQKYCMLTLPGKLEVFPRSKFSPAGVWILHVPPKTSPSWWCYLKMLTSKML